MKTLIIAEHDNKNLKLASAHTVNAAGHLSQEIDILVVGYQCESVAKQAAELKGLNAVLVLDHEVYQHQLAENLALAIAEISQDYACLLAPSTTFGKNILPRVAALLDVEMVSDVIKIISENNYVRPIYAGNALATVQNEERIKLLTIRTSAFSKPKNTVNIDKKTPIKILSNPKYIFENTQSKFENEELTKSIRPELSASKIIIAGGRGLKSAENFKLLEDIADDLGASVGASRAAVDAGFAPNDYQIGQTGKVVAPELYIAVGISGAIQHLAGMKDSKVIVAINNDPDAPIYEIADYGLLGDLFTILPQLHEEIKKTIR